VNLEGNKKKRDYKMPFDKRWDAKFQLLKVYQREHGHVNVPQRPTDSSLKSLAKWVRRQRERYKAQKPTHKTASRAITTEEIEALESIGFLWELSLGQKTWPVRYQQLVEFRQKYKHTRVPGSLPQLGEWVQNQRRQKERLDQGKSSTLTPERIQRLYDLEFIWKPRKVDTAVKWQDHYDRLRAFKEEHGSCDLSLLPPDQRKKQEYILLDSWMHQQRVSYRKFLDGYERAMGVKKANKLAELGFDWKFDRPLLDHEVKNATIQDAYAPTESTRTKRVYVKTEKYRTRPKKKKTMDAIGDALETTDETIDEEAGRSSVEAV
jgi:hypothetical protein